MFARILPLTVTATLLGACASSGPDDEGAAAVAATSAIAVDARIRSDLERALSVGARCRVGDEACRAATLDRIAKGDRSDPVVAKVVERVGALGREEFCAALAREDGALFAVGADSVARTNEAAILFDLTSFRAAVVTSADGLSDVLDGAPYEAFSRAADTFPPAWGADPKADGADRFAAAEGLGGAILPSRAPGEVRSALISLVSVDGSTFLAAPRPSPTSALRVARMLGGKARGDLVEFERSASRGGGLAIATAIAQVAGIEGLAARAATIAIARDRLTSFAGGVAAYCRAREGTLATRSFGGGGYEGLGGLQDRSASATPEDAPLDCSSGFAELACDAVFPGKALVCAQNGPGKGSCCRKPITESLETYKACTPGPDSGCPTGTFCQRAAESGPTAERYLCVGADACAAFEGAPEPRPADFVRKAKGRIAECFTHNWANEGFRYAEDPRYLPDSNWGYWIGAKLAELVLAIGDSAGYLLFKGSEGDKLLNESIERLKELARSQNLYPYQQTLAAQCVSAELFEYSFDSIAKFLGSSAAAEREAGVCTEFSSVAARLLNGTGIWAKVIGSVAERHAFVETYYPQVDKTSYYIEPQQNPAGNPRVKFYNKH